MKHFWLFVAIYLAQPQVSASSYKLNCDSSGHLLKLQNQTISFGVIAKTQMQNSMDLYSLVNDNPACRAPSSKLKFTKPVNGIALPSEANSPMRNLTTRFANIKTWFDRDQIKQIIKLSLDEGIDPYVAISILLLENPPFYGVDYNSDNVESWKTLPGGSLNHQAVTQALGCKKRDKKWRIGDGRDVSTEDYRQYRALVDCGEHPECYGPIQQFEEGVGLHKSEILRCAVSPKCVGDLSPASVVQVLDLRKNKGSIPYRAKLCAGSTVWSGTMSSLDLQQTDANGDCCADIIAEKSVENLPQLVKEFNKRARPALFVKAIKDKLKTPASKSIPMNPYETFAHKLQAYQGYGHYSHQVHNRCAEGMNMNHTPLYGAYVGDLITNALYANPDFLSLVKAVAEQEGKPIVSEFCRQNKVGPDVLVDSKRFLELEKEFVSDNGLSATRFSDCTKGKPDITFETWSELDFKKFMGLHPF